MKKFQLVLVILIVATSCFGQKSKDLALSISAGKLVSPFYSNNTYGQFFNIDFDYYLSRRHVLSASYFDGRHSYFDQIPFIDMRSDGTNSIAKYHTFSVLYKYSFLDKRHISATVGAGAGMMTHSTTNPYKTTNGGSTFQDATWTDLVFPVKLEAQYKATRHFRAGLIAGLFIAPDFPILAYHIGPRLTYVLD